MQQAAESGFSKQIVAHLVKKIFPHSFAILMAASQRFIF
jgi:hypothetical protein